MNLGEEIIVGRMGNQPMCIADTNVDPYHAKLCKIGDGVFQIEDNGSGKGIFVFGMRIKRKTIKSDTPFLLGTFKTSVNQLLFDTSVVDLKNIWKEYDDEKKKWDRKTMLVNYLRVLPSILTMILGIFLGQDMDNTVRMGVTITLTVTVLVVSMIISEKIMAKKNLKMTKMNDKMQTKYVCPHCHKFLSLKPYEILKQNIYCPNCNFPLP